MIDAGCFRDRYRIGGQADSHGLVRSFRAVDTATSDPVLLKILRTDATCDSSRLSPLVHEFVVLSGLSHDGVPKVLNFVSDSDDGQILVLENAEGYMTTEAWMVSGPSTQSIVQWFSRLLLALEYVHSRGVLHMGIDRRSVLVSEDEESGDLSVRLTDFTAAALQPGSVIASAEHLFGEGLRRGEPRTAPDQRSDLWAAAALARHVLSGGQIDVSAVNSSAEDLTQQRPDLPHALVFLISRMLEQTGRKSPASVREVRMLIETSKAPGFALPASAPALRLDHAVVPRERALYRLTDAVSKSRSCTVCLLLFVGAQGCGKSTLGHLCRMVSQVKGCQHMLCTEPAICCDATKLAQPFRMLGDRLIERVGDGARPTESGAPAGRRGSELRQLGLDPDLPFLGFADDIDKLSEGDIEILLDTLRHMAHWFPGATLVGTCREVPWGLLRSDTVLLGGGGANSADVLRQCVALQVEPLGGFSIEEAAALVTELTTAAVPDDVANWILRRTDGNPLFMSEFTHFLVSRGCLESDLGTLSLDVARAERAGLPASIGAVIRERIDALPPEECRVARIVALGPGVDLAAIASLSGIEVEQVRRIMISLGARGLLRPPDTGGQYSFEHEWIRQSVYSSTSSHLRKRLHRRLARLLRSRRSKSPLTARWKELLAWHLSRGGLESQAVDPALEAAAALAETGQHEDSIRCARMAEQLLVDAGEGCCASVEAMRTIGDIYWRIGRASDAARVYARIRDGSTASGETSHAHSAIELNWALGRAYALSGRPTEALETFERASERAQKAADPLWMARIYSSMGVVLQMRGRFSEIERLADDSIKLLAGSNSPDLLASSYNSKGNALLAQCKWEEARSWFSNAIELAEEGGVAPLACLSRCNLGVVCLYTGEWRDATRLLDASLSQARGLGSAYCLHVVLNNTGMLRLRQGMLSDAEALFWEAAAQARKTGDSWGLSLVLANVGELEHDRGNEERALHLYSRSEELAAEVGAVDDLPELRRRRAESLLAVGLVDEAHEAAVWSRRASAEMGNCVEAANCARVLSSVLLERGDGEEAIRLCQQSIEELTAIGARYELAQSQMAMGHIMREFGDRNQAVALLAVAREVFLQLGARRGGQRAFEESALARGSWRPLPRGLPSERGRLAALYDASRTLTSSAQPDEIAREVADLVAANVSADAIAVVLFAQMPETSRLITSSFGASIPESDDLRSLVAALLSDEPAGTRIITDDDASAPLSLLLRTRGIREALVAPMCAGDHRVGALYLDQRRRGRGFSQEDSSFVDALAAQAAVAFENADLRQRLREEVEYLKWEVDSRYSFASIIGQSPGMQNVFSLLRKVARTSVTVLIEGESGTGKELAARAIHFCGPRKEARFVPQNCAALPEQLLESELFGHVKGAFTGALKDKRGLFEAADGGTFFLDEIADMPPSLQVKLLRVLQDGEVRRVGATEPSRVDVRIIAAANRPLEEEVEAGRFRKDLFYRLNVVRIVMPPLRQRRDDIPLLAQHFLDDLADECGKTSRGFSDEAMSLLMSYDWPGNVRELENEIRRAVALAEPSVGITRDKLSERIRAVDPVLRPPRPSPCASLKGMVEEMEQRVILQVLHEYDWNKSRAADALGLSRQGLLKKIARYKLKPERD